MAEAHGLEVGEARVLSDRSNVLVALTPAPVVARVATATASVRAGGAREWLARDVAMAGWLASEGAPVVPPATELPPGPHMEDGLAVTFWRHVEHNRTGRPSPRETGAALRQLHEALEGYPGALPPFDAVLDECAVVMERLASPAATASASPAALARMRAALDRIRAEIAAAGLPARPLHGDASPGNLLRIRNGLLWTDFEDCCAAPVEWDLACLVASGDPDPALDGYGRRPPAEALAPFLDARRLQGDLWTALLAERHPDLRARAEERLRRWE